MGYFGGSSRFAGDPGFFDTFKRVAGGFLRGGPSGAIVAALSRRAPTPRARPVTRVKSVRDFAPPQISVPLGQRLGQIQTPAARGMTGMEVMMPRRRRMNVGNAKALRRAIRRTDGFVRLARSALKNTGFKIVSKSSGKLTQAAWEKKAHHAK